MYAAVFDQHAQLLKALSHPRRLEIVNLLRDQSLVVSDIHTMLDLPQANISQHLGVLRDAGIVNTRREGKQIFYSVADPKILAACDNIRSFLIKKLGDQEMDNEFKIDIMDLMPLTHDPVCGMRLSPKTAGFSTKYLQSQFYFCASGCLKEFERNPQAYV